MSLPSPAQDDYSPSPSPRALSQFTSSPLPHSPIALDPCESGAEDQFSGDPSHTNKQANNQENSVLEPLPMLDTSHSDSTSLDLSLIHI